MLIRQGLQGALLLRDAGEIRDIVRVAGALALGDLRIGAKWARHLDTLRRLRSAISVRSDMTASEIEHSHAVNRTPAHEP